MNFKIQLTLILFGLATQLSAQTVMLEQDVLADSTRGENGPNTKHFWMSAMSYGLILGEPEGDGSELIMGASYEYQIGIRYKRKINNFYAVGFGIDFNKLIYQIRQEEDKILPNLLMHDKEKIQVSNLGVSLYNRFNFGKRGNTIGQYFDVGGYATFAVATKHITMDEAILIDTKRTEVTNKGLAYIEPLNYGVNLRIGKGKFALTGKYRLSNTIKADFSYGELPRIVAGIEIGLGG